MQHDFDALSQPVEGTNRAMSVESLCRNLADSTGTEVEPTNLHHTMRAIFGDYASATSLKAVGVLSDLTTKTHEDEASQMNEKGLYSDVVNTAAAVWLSLDYILGTV